MNSAASGSLLVAMGLCWAEELWLLVPEQQAVEL